MPTQRIFQPKPIFIRKLLQFRPFPRRSASILFLLLTWAVPSAVLAILPQLWVKNRTVNATETFKLFAHKQGHRIVDRWGQQVAVPDFQVGNEPEVAACLGREPLLRALIDLAHQAVWVREGDQRLVPASLFDKEILLGWANVAMKSGNAHWIPTPAMDPQYLESSSLLVASGRWWALKKWSPGEPEVDRFLLGCLGYDSPMRFGIIHYGGERIPVRRKTAGSSLPGPADGLQYVLGDGYYDGEYPCLTKLFGNVWGVVAAMAPSERAGLRTRIGHWRTWAWSIYGSGVLLSGLAILVWLQMRHRERLAADRLASLTHSLKTPLAILKLRCDTARNATLPREQQEAYLASIGDEVDHLVQYIESGLESIRPKLMRSALVSVDDALFERLDEDFRAAFEEVHREMRFDIGTARFWANEQALHAALATLLENALIHGQGVVELKVERKRNLVAIQVRDQGPGVDLGPSGSYFEDWGQPRPRKRDSGARRGQGLGLMLLANLADREGWGLFFQSIPSQGFACVVEIRQ